MKTIYLPAGTEYVLFDELALLIADALHPDAGEDDERSDYGIFCLRFETELSNAVKSGALPVKDAMTFGPHPHPVGRALQTALVSVHDLRVFLAGRPIAIKLETAKTAATPAPVVAASASGSVEPDKAGPLPLTTGDIAFCFAGLSWNEQEWKKPLGDKPKWLSACIAIPAVRGVSESRWNPVLIGASLVRVRHVKPKSVRAKFQTQPLLKPWLDEWKTYEADNLSAD